MPEKPAAIITGGGSGIGAAIVEKLSSNFNVISVDKNYQHPIKGVFQFVADVTSESDIAKLFDFIKANKLYLQALVNNAGISQKNSLLETQLSTWNKVLDTNLTGPFLMSKEFAKRGDFNSNQPGIVVNIASVSGMVGMPNYAAYNCSKAGLIELTKTMALELAPHIHSSAICPGYILTPMQRREYSEEALDKCAQENPSKRLGSPEEVAELVSFVLSRRNSYLNGSILVMDGGETSGGLAST